MDNADKSLPSSIEAESAVLGAILLDDSLIFQVVENVSPDYFYHPAHRKIFAAMLSLFKRGLSIEPILLGEELKRLGHFESIGGYSFIADLTTGLPRTSQIASYLDVLRGKARLRSLIAISRANIASALEGDEEPETILASAENKIFGLTSERYKSGLVKASIFLESVMDSAEASIVAGATGTNLTAQGLDTGFLELNELTAGLQKGDLILLAARPGAGKTSFAECLANNITLRGGKSCAFFTLEMSKEAIMSRSICAESRADHQRYRKGFSTHEEWGRINEARVAFETAPLYLDDTPAITVLELKAKCLRLQAEMGEPIGLIIVDFLTLMTGNRETRRESRQQEVSGIARDLKAVAKSLNVPLMALAQLSRAPELRSDHRPVLADLRECLTGDTIIPNADTGDLIRIADFPKVGYSLTPSHKSERAKIGEVWSTGIKPIWKILTASGRTLRCTANHPLLTIMGWRRLCEISLGTRVAVPRSVPEPKNPTNPFNHEQLRLLGYLISDGHYGKHRSVGYVKNDPVLVADVREIVQNIFGIVAKNHQCHGTSEQIELTVTDCGPQGNPLINWLRNDLGIHGQLGQHKRIPKEVWRCDNDRLRVFLGALWSGDGTVVLGKRVAIKFSSTSMGLLDDVAWCLTRLGIGFSRSLPSRRGKSTMDIADIAITDRLQILRFAELVPLIGIKAQKLQTAAARVQKLNRNSKLDRLPLEITSLVAEKKSELGLSWSKLTYRCQGKEMCREDLGRVATIFNDEILSSLAESDILWDEIVEITADGEEEVFDFTVPETANLVANGFFVHNSGELEQAADLVLFLYREAQYTKGLSDENKRTAELIIGKQRNGPPGTILLRFEARCFRFDNLQHEF